jgi:hypothetical protein
LSPGSAGSQYQPELVDEVDRLLPRVRKLVDKYDPPGLPLA